MSPEVLPIIILLHVLVLVLYILTQWTSPKNKREKSLGSNGTELSFLRENLRDLAGEDVDGDIEEMIIDGQIQEGRSIFTLKICKYITTLGIICVRTLAYFKKLLMKVVG